MFFTSSFKLAATPPQKSWKPCASWSPVLRMMWHGSIDVALFVGVAETKNVPMVAATLQPMPVKAVAAWRIFWGRVGETFGRKIWNVCIASGRHNRHVFFDGGLKYIQTRTTVIRPSPDVERQLRPIHDFLGWAGHMKQWRFHRYIKI